MDRVVKRKKKAVSSKIEITGWKQYRLNLKELEEKVYKAVIPLSDNLLSLKIALMNVVRRIEERMRENEKR